MLQFKNKISIANSGINSAWYGKHHTLDEIEKIRNSNKGKFISEETRIKMSNAQKMNKNHPKGWHHSEETKRKLSELGKTRKLSEY